jgi:Flp pilus assembly protein CpaB
VIARRWWLALATVAAVIAGAAFYVATLRVDVVVAARDIAAPRPLTAEDLDVRSVSAELAPADVARRIGDVLGLVPRAPLWRGQLILPRALSSETADFGSGLTIAPGRRAVAIPVSAASAVGGAVVAGALVDVVAIPVLGRAPAGRSTELLVTGATVLDVRAESGVPMRERGEDGLAGSGDRLGSVVIAIDAADTLVFADRIATSTFVLALAGAR